VSLSLLDPPFVPVQFVERRTVARQRPSTCRARVAWREGGLRFEKASVSLLDLSPRGAQVLSPVYSRAGRTVFIGLASLPNEWVRAVVRSSELSGNQWLCRLEFREPCPAGMLELALPEPSLGWSR
jgi:hypothetical protein